MSSLFWELIKSLEAEVTEAQRIGLKVLKGSIKEVFRLYQDIYLRDAWRNLKKRWS